VSSSSQERKATAFAALHTGEPFVIPNPWDAGSARVLEALGFAALATTSSGLAFTLGRLDGAATLDEVCRHVASLDRATELPISADLENGFGPRPEDAAHAIQRVAEAGAVGGALTWVAAKAFADAATAIRDSGDLSALAARLPLERWLAPDHER
jgi:2-methylisocitrate lyase-like PEP mutase family enzyme